MSSESIPIWQLGVHGLYDAIQGGLMPDWPDDPDPVEDPYEIIEQLQGTIAALQGIIAELM